MIQSDDTIAAIATPLGPGGLGVVRLSGPDSVAIADRVFKSGQKTLAACQSHTLHLGWIFSGKEKIDQVVASLFLAPRSFTGENVVEFSCHGSPFVLKEILALLVAAGARLAGPGEFTARAYLNGRMDLLQAEAVADLIGATSHKNREIATQHLRGVLSARLQTIRGKLIDFLAHLEANLDFAEEDIPGCSRTEMRQHLQIGRDALDKLLNTSLRGNVIRDGVRIALIGRANVGKSSLFNAFLARERAIVTDIPGTTRDVLEERIEWEGISVVMSDTAGYKIAEGEPDKLGLERARETQRLANIIFFVFDGSRPLEEEDRAIAQGFQGKEVVVVLNKMDRGLKSTPRDIKREFGFEHVVATSAKEGTGLLELKEAAVQMFKKSIPEVEDGFILTNMRHINHLERAVAHLGEGLAALNSGRSEEVVAVDVQNALKELGAITGEDASEEILSAIFSRFCVGK